MQTELWQPKARGYELVDPLQTLFKQKVQGYYVAYVTAHSESQQEPAWTQQPPAKESDGRARPLH